jgi:hypothetical protein
MKTHTILVTALSATALFWSPTLRATETGRFEKGAALVAKQEYVQAAQIFREGVDAGDAACMDFLGWLYLEGRGVRQSSWIAHGYFRAADELGSIQACRNLGNMHYGARGLEQSTEAAIAWWQKAASQGEMRAAFDLAAVLYAGAGTAPDRERALEIWRQSAGKGHAPSVAALAFAGADGQLAKIETDVLRAPSLSENSGAQALLRLAELQQSGRVQCYIPVEFEPQAHNFCALATTSHILKSSGVQTSQFAIARKLDPPVWGRGSDWGRMQRVAAEYGRRLAIQTFPVSDEGFDEGCRILFKELEAGRPAVVDTLDDPAARSAHTVLLTGCTTAMEHFVIRDSAQPFPGIRVLEREEFKRIWNSVGFLPTNRELKRACMILEP